ncbi:MAG: NADH-quinone oxidoreductase subunit D [Armatimonadetes bacterium]|nr:NADH-quinone oxidoreductase subunit D [Armatimonadota bacterium]
MATETKQTSEPDGVLRLGGPGLAAEPTGDIHEIETDHLEVSMGPQHPSTHGVLRLKVKLDGEWVTEVQPEIGYLHRGVEKIAENRTYFQFLTITDRLDYVAAMACNAAYAVAVEKLAGLTVPPRAELCRVIVQELDRIASHLVSVGTYGLDLGATSPFIYAFRDRETILDLLEMVCGARLTYSYIRVGGVARDLPEGEWRTRFRQFLDEFPPMLDEQDTLLSENEIFLLRTRGVGVLPPEVAVNYGTSGPVLRGSGVAYDVRRSKPYGLYPQLDFNVVTRPTGDCLARYQVRVEEMRQSVKILRQCDQLLDEIPPGEVLAKGARGVKPAAGEAYASVESPRGEMGVYLISDGSNKPYRLKWRSPSFVNLSVLSAIGRGWKVADLVAIIGSIDPVFGDVDR